MANSTNKILIALDGSSQSINAARYISRVIPPENAKIVLFSVRTKAPDSYWDFDETPDISEQQPALKIWYEKHNEILNKTMEAVKQFFIDAGYSEDAVSVKVQDRQVGIARDILKESYNGYTAVVLGRTGMSSNIGIPMGSITAKLLPKIHHATFIMVGDAPETERFLIGFDGSHGSKKAVSAVKSLLKNSAKKINICHVLRSMNLLQGSYDLFQFNFDQAYFPKEEKARLETVEKKLEPEINFARNKLVDAGIPALNVQTKMMMGYQSRAASLYNEAEKEGYGTIVIGRRGISIVEEFFMGRVARKITQMAKNHAVWVAS